MHDFSQVRVGTDVRTLRSVDAAGARACTVGSDIAFRQGKYLPRTIEGKRLLA